MESAQEIKSRTIQVKKKKSIILVTAFEAKEKKGVKKNVIDTPQESNVNTVVEEHFSSENV